MELPEIDAEAREKKGGGVGFLGNQLRDSGNRRRIAVRS